MYEVTFPPKPEKKQLFSLPSWMKRKPSKSKKTSSGKTKKLLALPKWVKRLVSKPQEIPVATVKKVIAPVVAPAVTPPRPQANPPPRPRRVSASEFIGIKLTGTGGFMGEGGFESCEEFYLNKMMEFYEAQNISLSPKEREEPKLWVNPHLGKIEVAPPEWLRAIEYKKPSKTKAAPGNPTEEEETSEEVHAECA